MNLVLYAPPGDDDGSRLEALVRDTRSGESLEVYHSLAGLVRALGDRRNGPTTCILVTPDRRQLLEIAESRDALGGVHLVLVLPDQDEETLAIAHRLRPRFLTCGGGNFRDLLAVIDRKVHYRSALH